MLRVADLELRGVDADRNPTGAGGEIVAGEGALVLFRKTPRPVEGQRMGGDDLPGEKVVTEIHGEGEASADIQTGLSS